MFKAFKIRLNEMNFLKMVKDIWTELQTSAYLQPLSLHKTLEAPDSPAEWIKDDLS